MITRVTLYPGGLISCRNEDGYQLPSSQGLFKDVRKKIAELPESIIWEIAVVGSVIVSKEEFFKFADRIVDVPFDKISAESLRLQLGQ
jgi:hypothetical protein